MGRLAGRKLLEYTPNLGMRVAKTSNKDIAEIFEIREVLEGAAVRLATQRMTDSEIGELSELLEKHRHGAELRDGSAYYQRAGDLDFHFRIASASGNERLVQLLCEDLYHFLRIHRFRASAKPGRAPIAFEEHRAIVAAIRRRDAEGAERLMRRRIPRRTRSAYRCTQIRRRDRRQPACSAFGRRRISSTFSMSSTILIKSSCWLLGMMPAASLRNLSMMSWDVLRTIARCRAAPRKVSVSV